MTTETKPFSFSKLFLLKKEYIKVCERDELEINEMKNFRIRGKNILLCRSEKGYYALQDKCSHKRSALSKGVMIAHTIQCLKHGCQFSVESGIVKKGPAKKPLKVYSVLEKEDAVWIEV